MNLMLPPELTDFSASTNIPKLNAVKLKTSGKLCKSIFLAVEVQNITRMRNQNVKITSPLKAMENDSDKNHRIVLKKCLKVYL